jgi:hypothetical protein
MRELDHLAVPVVHTPPCPMRARSTAPPRSLAATHRQVGPLRSDVTASQVVPVDDLPPTHLVPKLVMQYDRSGSSEGVSSPTLHFSEVGGRASGFGGYW